MSIATSREHRLSKPGPLIADPSNTAAPATASHRAAAAAEVERRIRAEISAQRAAEGSPVITPPPETPITTTTGNLRPLSPIEENEVELDNLKDKSARRSTKTKRAHDVPVNGMSYYLIVMIFNPSLSVNSVLKMI